MRVKTVKANLCMTPSPWLLQHEWQAHGTCNWKTPEAYFKKARQIRERLHASLQGARYPSTAHRRSQQIHGSDSKHSQPRGAVAMAAPGQKKRQQSEQTLKARR